MQTITQSIGEILRQSPFLTEALSEGIVNYTALARKLRPDLEKMHLRPFTTGAIIMALRKLHATTKTARSNVLAVSTIKSITVRSNLVQLAFKNSRNLHRLQEKILRLAEEDEDLTVYFARGTTETGIIVSDELEDAVKKLSDGETIIRRYRDLSSVSIRFHPSITDVPGVYYPFFQALAWKGINFVQLVSGYAELTFLFDSKEIDRAFAAIKSLSDKRPNRK